MNDNFQEKSSLESNVGKSLFIPIALVAVAVFGLTLLPTIRLWSERGALTDAHTQQETPLANANKIRVAADSLFTKTKALADKGNPSASEVVEALKKRGFTITPKVQPATPQLQ